MSKGSKIVPIRIPAELLACLDAEMSRQAAGGNGKIQTRTDYILAAIADKIKHAARSRKKTAQLPTSYARDKHVHDPELARERQRQTLIAMAAVRPVATGGVIHACSQTDDTGAKATGIKV